MRFGYPKAAFLALLGLMSGCSVGPDYEHPQTALPDHWDATTDREIKAAVASDWWASFRHTDLDSLIARAQKGSFDLAAAVARVAQADAQLRIASAPLLPTIGLTGGAGRSGSQTLTSGKGAQYNNFNLVMGASYELDFWGKNADARQAALANLNASRFDRQTTLLTLNASVASTYFTILSLSDRIKVAEHNLSNSQTTLEGRNGVGP